jgi:hypothetical protein
MQGTAGQPLRLSLFCQWGTGIKYASFNFNSLLNVNSRRKAMVTPKTGVQQ